MLAITLLYGCVETGQNAYPQLSESFSETVYSQTLDLTTSSIKDVVYALPHHSYYEATTEYAHDLIAKEAVKFRRFRGAALESVDYVGDGSAGISRFFLDRTLGVLWKYYFAYEYGRAHSITRYRPVPGGWMIHREAATEKEKTEQEGTGQPATRSESDLRAATNLNLKQRSTPRSVLLEIKNQ